MRNPKNKFLLRLITLAFVCVSVTACGVNRNQETDYNVGYGKVVDVQYSPSKTRFLAPDSPDFYIAILDTEDRLYTCKIYVDDLVYLPKEETWVKFKYPDFDGIGGSIYCDDFEEK